MCDMKRHLNKQTAKPALYKAKSEIKLNISAKTSYTLKCLLEYRSQHIPAERRHRSRCCTSRNSSDKTSCT